MFTIRERGSTVKQELLAGFTTFSSMVYIIFVNPSILAETGLDFGALMVATILTTVFSCAFMAFYADQPIAIAPGMGVSAFFTFTVILQHDNPVGMGLAAVLLSAIALFVLNQLGIREKILKSIPHPLVKGTVTGIGLFLIVVGLRQIGIVSPTLDGFITFHSPLTYPALLTTIGLVVITVLINFKVRAAFLIGILINWILSLIIGLSEWKGLVAMPPSLAPNLFQVDFASILTPAFLQVFFSIFLVTLFDSSAALIVLSKMLYPAGDLPRPRRCLTPDTCGSAVGSLLGCTSMAIHLESVSGIKIGGKSGLTALVVSIGFLLCIFFYPLVHSIPHFATSPVLVVIGVIMIREMGSALWNDATDVIPMLIAAIVMPITFSIYLGFATSYVAYSLIKLITGRIGTVHYFTWGLSILFAIHLVMLWTGFLTT